jgi:hypothetical protein
MIDDARNHEREALHLFERVKDSLTFED